MRAARPLTAALTVLASAVVLTACGSSGTSSHDTVAAGAPVSAHRPSAAVPLSTAPAADHGKVSGPCDVTDRATVASVFAGAGAGSAGQVRNCTYPLATGQGAAISAVNVFYYGSSDDWATQLAQARQYVGPLTPLSIGDAAYFAVKGGGAVTVRKGAIIFAVQVLPNGMPTTAFFTAHRPELEALATKIAAQH
jgi:hypothetical protein